MTTWHPLTLCFSAWMLVVGSLLPAQSLAEPATELYVGHVARLTAEIPMRWQPDATGRYDYAGADGFVASDSVPGSVKTLDAACEYVAQQLHPDATASITYRTWHGEAACEVRPSAKGEQTAVFVVPHPKPFERDDALVRYVALYADPAHLDAIVASLDFSPAKVTPEAYLSSVLDLMEANAVRGDQVDWPAVRRRALASVTRVSRTSGTYPEIQQALGALREAGDYHSFFLSPAALAQYGQTDRSGFGLFMLGPRVTIVYPGGPADRAGIQVGDIVEKVNGQPFDPRIDTDTVVNPDLAWRATREGSVRLELRREVAGKPVPITATVERGVVDLSILPTGERLPSDVGYIELLGVLEGWDTSETYATAGQEVIARIDQEPTCGWIVDLRRNTGGTYYPMVAGVGAILGEGPFVGWRRADGQQSFVVYQDGRILDDGEDTGGQLVQGPLYTLRRPAPSVAVLISPLTGSSGEVTTLAFVGRPGTRTFGQPSLGLTTANKGFQLFDGAVLVLAEADMIDRTGGRHLDGVQPDDVVPIDWESYGTKDDRVVQAARAWLEQQPACTEGDVAALH